MSYLGDFSTGAIVYCPFTTYAASGASVAFSNALEAADIRVYKDGSNTERTSQSGFTITSAFDSIVGGHMAVIDLSDNTDAGFYAAGHDYSIWLVPDTETVDSLTVNGCIGRFSIQNRHVTTASVATAIWTDARSGYKGTGTAAGGTAGSGSTGGTVILASGAGAALGVKAGDFIIVNIDGILDGNNVASISTDTCTMDGPWGSGVAPDNNDTYYVFSGGTGVTSTTLAAAVLAAALGAAAGSLTVEQWMTKMLAVTMGNHAGLVAGAGTITFKDAAGTNAVSFAVDADGNVTSLNLAP